MLNSRDIFYRHMGLPSSEPLGIEIVGANGIYLTDATGKNYIDAVSGVAVSNLGHNHPAIVEAIREQAGKFTHLMVYGELIQSPQTLFAEMLLSKLPEELDRVYFVNSGSEAIEGAMKLSKRYTGRTRIVSFKNAYHGGTQGALSILGNEEMKYAFRPLLPEIYQIDFNAFDQLDIIDEQTACVVIEPIQAEAGIILPEKGYLEELRKKCDKTGALLVFDEIQMGMGRSGKLFAFEDEAVVPDILCLAKALGGGLPLGAFIASNEIMSALTHKPALGHITTFGGHPLSCAAGLAALRAIYNEGLIKQADSRGSEIAEYLKKHELINSIRRKGLMLGVELKKGMDLSMLMKLFVKNGLLIDRFLFNHSAFRIAPPLIISKQETYELCERIIKSLDMLNR